MLMSNRPDPTSRPRRMMVYCHDSMGIGHLRRSMAICDRVSSGFPRSSFLIATGSPYVPLFAMPRGVDYVKLPALSKRRNGDYESKYLSLRTKPLMKCRRALLLATVNYFRPSILLVDKTPVGVLGEMVPVLEWIQRNCPETTVVFGMRDIEDAPEATIRQWSAGGVQDALEKYYDEIWVYGNKSAFDVVREYKLPKSVDDKLHYAGYLRRAACEHETTNDDHHRHVVVTVGAGSDGEELLERYVSKAARDVARSGGRSTIVGGPDVPEGVADRLRSAVAKLPRTHWLDHTRCMSCLMRDAHLVVSMGGYNTMCEIASWDVPALIVPRVKPRLEQSMRARIWEDLGVIRTVDPQTLTPSTLSGRILDMLDHPQPPSSSGLNLSGLDYIAGRCSALWNGGRSVEPALCV